MYGFTPAGAQTKIITKWVGNIEMSMKFLGLLKFAILLLLLLTACDAPQDPIKIGIAAWAGVEPAILAV